MMVAPANIFKKNLYIVSEVFIVDTERFHI